MAGLPPPLPGVPHRSVKLQKARPINLFKNFIVFGLVLAGWVGGWVDPLGGWMGFWKKVGGLVWAGKK